MGALAAWLIAAGAAAALVEPRAGWVALGALAALLALNAPLYGFFWRKRGIRFACAAVAMHGLYLLYSSAVFVALAVAARLPAIRRG
jgi:hypothetical protein